MKKIKNIFLSLGLLSLAMACDRDFDSEGITVGTIRFPSIELSGDIPYLQPKGSPFVDPGARALLGTDDITDRMEIDSDVDTSVPGLYLINYTVTTTNELEQESTALRRRPVVVREDNLCGVDISGSYKRSSGGALGNILITITQTDCGIFTIDNFLFRTSAISSVQAYLVSPTKLVIWQPNSPFGSYVIGTGTITPTGLQIAYDFPDIATFGLARTYVKQ